VKKRIRSEYDFYRVHWDLRKSYPDESSDTKFLLPTDPGIELNYWNFVSYGLIKDPSPEFVDYYHKRINWDVMSKYCDVGVMGLGTEKRKGDDNICFETKKDAIVVRHRDKLDLRFVLITFLILCRYQKDSERIREVIRSVLGSKTTEPLPGSFSGFGTKEDYYMHRCSKIFIENSYADLEKSLRDNDPKPSGNSTDMNVLLDRYDLDLRRKLYRQITAKKTENQEDAQVLVPWFYSPSVKALMDE